MNFLKRLFALLSSFGFAAILLVFLTLLTWLGTLEQVEHGLFETQRKYFESVFLVHRFAVTLPWYSDGSFEWTRLSLPLPLPGVYLLLSLLLLNLICGGILRMRKDKARLGILVAHLGIVLMLAAGFVKYRFSVDGQMTLWPGETKNQFASYFEWELTIHEAVPEGKVTQLVIPDRDWKDEVDDGPVTFTSDALPFDVVVGTWLKNCEALRKGPMFQGDSPVVDGYVLKSQPLEPEAENNLAGMALTLREKSGGKETAALLWGATDAFHDVRPLPHAPLLPVTVAGGGKKWLLSLRHRRFDLPFSVHLDKFTVEMHPRTNEPAVFLSDVTKIEESGSQPVKISMNEPLRHEGFTLFQGTWGPQNVPEGGEHYSGFAVVRNPSDQWPKWSCYIIAVGLLYHFAMKLMKYVKSENRLAAARAGGAAPGATAPDVTPTSTNGSAAQRRPAAAAAPAPLAAASKKK
jgi:ResB-like family protein